MAPCESSRSLRNSILFLLLRLLNQPLPLRIVNLKRRTFPAARPGMLGPCAADRTRRFHLLQGGYSIAVLVAANFFDVIAGAEVSHDFLKLRSGFLGNRRHRCRSKRGRARGRGGEGFVGVWGYKLVPTACAAASRGTVASGKADP